MRVVIDTNVLISALLVAESNAGSLIAAWREGRFTLVTCQTQIEELNRVTRYPKIRARLQSSLAGRLVNELRDIALYQKHLPAIDRSRDPYDNFLLAMSVAARADYLVSGDKRDILSIGKYENTTIVSVRAFLECLEY